MNGFDQPKLNERQASGQGIIETSDAFKMSVKREV